MFLEKAVNHFTAFLFCLLMILRFILICITCLLGTLQQVKAQTQQFITRSGDTIIMKQPTTRTLKVGGIEKEVTITTARPLLLNGKYIYYYKDDKTDFRPSDEFYDSATIAHNRIDDSLLSVTALARKQLPDGIYKLDISNVVVDERGTIVYYEVGVLKKYVDGNNIVSQYSEADVPEIPASIIKNIVDKNLRDAKYVPLRINNKPTPYIFSLDFHFNQKWGDESPDYKSFFRRHIK